MAGEDDDSPSNCRGKVGQIIPLKTESTHLTNGNIQPGPSPR